MRVCQSHGEGSLGTSGDSYGFGVLRNPSRGAALVCCVRVPVRVPNQATASARARPPGTHPPPPTARVPPYEPCGFPEPPQRCGHATCRACGVLDSALSTFCSNAPVNTRRTLFKTNPVYSFARAHTMVLRGDAQPLVGLGGGVFSVVTPTPPPPH